MALPAVVLAGGLGTRLASVTGDRLPKALVDVAGRPFLDRKLDELERGGVSDILLLVGHHGQSIADHLRANPRAGARVRCRFDGPHPLGTGGALRAAADELAEVFWLTYGDTLLEASMADVEGAWRASGRDALMTVVENADREQTSNTTVVDGTVVAYAKGDPPGTHRFLDYGLLILPKAAVVADDLPDAFDLGLVVSRLAADGRLAAAVVDGWFHDIGTPEALRETTRWCSGAGR